VDRYGILKDSQPLYSAVSKPGAWDSRLHRDMTDDMENMGGADFSTTSSEKSLPHPYLLSIEEPTKTRTPAGQEIRFSVAARLSESKGNTVCSHQPSPRRDPTETGRLNR
jgi:hypothetical protein